MRFSDDSLVPGCSKRSCFHFGLKPPRGQRPRVHRTTWESKHIGLNVTLVIMASQPTPPNLPPPEIRVRWGRVG